MLSLNICRCSGIFLSSRARTGMATTYITLGMVEARSATNEKHAHTRRGWGRGEEAQETAQEWLTRSGTFIPHASSSLQKWGGDCGHPTAPFTRPRECFNDWGGRGYDDSVPGRSPKQPLPGIGLHDPLHDRQACPKFNSFHQEIGQISPREGLVSCRPLPKRGQICDIPGAGTRASHRGGTRVRGTGKDKRSWGRDRSWGRERRWERDRGRKRGRER